MDKPNNFDAIIIGTGAAGLSAALHLAPLNVLVITKTSVLDSGSTKWAQGGIAAAVAENDSPESHIQDSLTASAGSADPAAVTALCTKGPAAIKWLDSIGMEFDRTYNGGFSLGREAAHSERRILHTGGGATGEALSKTLISAAHSAQHITLKTSTMAWNLIIENGQVCGLNTFTPNGWQNFYSPNVIIASGGIGQLYPFTTNPAESTADGLTLGARAGAKLADLEMIQFHPTALAIEENDGCLPLLSEALRGEGATLLNANGERFMPSAHPLAELAPRDVVAREVWRNRTHHGGAFLDARPINNFRQKFSSIYNLCKKAGFDPNTDLLPITPAAHYHMGGVLTDEFGRTSINGLWAIGESACTGVHGANRLASNSLLECLVFAKITADEIKNQPKVITQPNYAAPQVAESVGESHLIIRKKLKNIMTTAAGLERSGETISAKLTELSNLCLAKSQPTTYAAARSQREAENMLLAANLILQSAQDRTESRGAHQRSDFPQMDKKFTTRHITTLEKSSAKLNAA